jgi:hypothetical protein
MADVGELVRSTTGPMDGQATAALPATRFAPGARAGRLRRLLARSASDVAL